MINRLSKILFFGYIVLMLLLFIQYLDIHDSHQYSFEKFKIFGFLLFAQIFGIIIFTLVHFINNKRIKSLFYSPIFLVFISIIISLSVFYAFDEFIRKSLSLDEACKLSIKNVSILCFLSLVYLIAKVLGTKVVNNSLKSENSTTSSIGICLLITIFFILSIFNALNIYSVLLSLAAVLLIGYKQVLATLKSFIKPIQDHQNINYWGFIIFYLLLIALTINFLAIQSPYPFGFDARNYYMNSTQLIAQSQGLIEGFQPYNWQLFMSLGFILFDSHEVAISLSFFAFILCLVAINDFTKDILKLDINYRLLIMLLITVSPAFYNQLSIDVKIDFALLFYQIVIVHLFVKLCQAKEWNWKLIIIFGLLNGFALGIKFTHLYLLASMIIVYWGIQGGVVALLSGAALGVGAFLIAKIDDVGGLRSAHLGVDYQQWIVLAIGVGLFIFLAISEREKWLKLMRFSLLFGAIAIIPMLPWMGKNYIETKSLSPKTLLMGKAPGYQMNLNSFIKNYEAQK